MFKSTTSFDKLIEKATSLSNLEPDWTTILQICDSIRQGDVQPKYAVSSIKKKLYATNPNVELLALQVLESCVKNCGTPFHNEIASKSFMEELRELIKVTTDAKVRDEVLRLIQAWAHAFRSDSNYRAVQDTLNLMKIEGYKFPTLKESDAMFVADSAPQWADGECCHRCRVQFSLVQRKHHCRNCGQIFCAKCSSKFSIIPKYGIEKEVRVCEDCYDKLNKPQAGKSDKTGSSASETVQFVSKSDESKTGKSEREIQEEEELQLALALSQSEAESKERDKQLARSSLGTSNYEMPTPTTKYMNKSILTSTSKTYESDVKSYQTNNNNNEDPELSRYLNRDYWEQKAVNFQLDDMSNPTPSAPQPQQIVNTLGNMSSVKTSQTSVSKSENKDQNHSDDMDRFMNNLRSAIEIFVNRIQSNRSRGRSIANDSAVQSLFINITNMHSQLLNYIQQHDNDRAHYESLQDKLNQVRDERAALDALREEHQEKLRREAEEADRVRQQQMAHKLEIMRKKKQEYLQYQREIALQRMQEQEREMLMRQEQQKYMWQQQQQQQQQMGTQSMGTQSMVYSQNPQYSTPNQSQPPVQFTTSQSSQVQPLQQQQQQQITQQSHLPMFPQQSPSHQGFQNSQNIVPNSIPPHYQSTGYVNDFPYNMHQMAASLPFINSNAPIQQPTVTSQPNIQHSNNQNEAEAPLISFD